MSQLETLRNFKRIIERKIDCLERGVPDDEGGYKFNQEERDIVAAWHKEHPGENPCPFVYTLPGVMAWEQARKAKEKGVADAG